MNFFSNCIISELIPYQILLPENTCIFIAKKYHPFFGSVVREFLDNSNVVVSSLVTMLPKRLSGTNPWLHLLAPSLP